MSSVLLPPGKLALKYLFCAKLADGTIIEQTEDDQSKSSSDRNCYYDLLERLPDGTPMLHESDRRIYARSDVELFQMEDSYGTRYLVDLRDGHFEVQTVNDDDEVSGAPFFIAIRPSGKTLRPFWFLRRRHHLVSGQEVSQECEYHFGWETEDRQQKAELILV